MKIEHVVPLLRIFDLAKAREFYIDWLGFSVDWEHRFEDVAPVYMQIRRGGSLLHLTEHHGDCCPGTTVLLQVTGLEDFHRELVAKNYRYYRPAIERMPWNADLMQVTDPFGNRIRFSQEVE
jgi:uncharacterized glyoxalase superfamily protein PhnB